jgi:hypothetical protein
MKATLSAVFAALAGASLAALLVHFVGFLAAVQSPAWLMGLSRPGHFDLARTLLWVSLPVGLIAYAFGECVFRLLSSSRKLAFTACLLGWIVPTLFVQLFTDSTGAAGAASNLFALLLNAGYWLAMAPVPAGLWLACRRARENLPHSNSPVAVR